MITGELKSRVDRIWNTMWSGGISNPLSVIEQLTYLLFIKGLDDLHTRKEHKAARTGNPMEEPVFAAHQDGLRWSRFKELAPEQMFETVRDRVFPFIKSMGQTGDSDEGSTYSHHMQDALFMMPTARVLANVVDQLDDIDMADRDTKGDLYEYMLGKIATAGQNGQFRTPRHIIKLMVDMTAPTPHDVICDPACGTAGFLVAASEHLVEHHGDRIYKERPSPPPVQRGHLPRLRLRHHHAAHRQHEHAAARRRESGHPLQGLAGRDGRGGSRGRRRTVLARPRQSAVCGQSRLRVHSQGPAAGRQDEEDRAGCSSPSSSACSRPAAAPPSSCPTACSSGRARRTGPCAGILVEEQKLDAIVSMPSGVFKPYAGVSTAILLFTKTNSGGTDDVWFYDMHGGRLLAGRQAHTATGQQ